VVELSGEEARTVGTGVDGCGVPTFSLSVAGMAIAWSRLAGAEARREADLDRAVGIVFDAIVTHPAYVAGTDRLTTVLIERAGARVVVKEGYEGVYCGAIRSEAVKGMGPRGVAIKVGDGATRAAEVALVEILTDLEVVQTDSDRVLADRRKPVIRNRAGEVAGHVDARLPLTRVTDGSAS
jgi:L-asparaginase II